MSIEVNPVLPIPKFIPGKIVLYKRPDGDLMPVRIIAAVIEAVTDDLDAFQVLYLCEWPTRNDEIHRAHIGESSLSRPGAEIDNA